MLRGSDGLDYEDLAARLVGEPAKTRRNDILGPDSAYGAEFKSDYRDAYDHYAAKGHDDLTCHTSGWAQATFSAQQRTARRREEVAAHLAQSYADAIDRAHYCALTGPAPISS